MGYSALLDFSTGTLTLLDQSSTDMHPVEDFNGKLYPTFGQVCILEVSACGLLLTEYQLNAQVIVRDQKTTQIF